MYAPQEESYDEFLISITADKIRHEVKHKKSYLIYYIDEQSMLKLFVGSDS